MCVTTGQLALPKERTSGLECVPEGKTVSYECTVNDPTDNGSTVWLGSAFNCSDSEIVLSHSAYSGVGVSVVCAGLSAQSVSENGTEFTSTLTLTATAQLNGTAINCTLNGMVSFRWETIRVCSVSCDPRELGDNITHSNDSGTASVPNGVVVFNGTEIRFVARLICEDGFSPTGRVIKTCLWSGNCNGQSQSCGVVTNFSPWWIPLVFCVGGAHFAIIHCVIVLSCIWATIRWHHHTRSIDLTKRSTHSKQADVKDTGEKQVKNSKLSSNNKMATHQARPFSRLSGNNPVTEVREALSSIDLNDLVNALVSCSLKEDSRPVHRRDYKSRNYHNPVMDLSVLVAAHTTPTIHSASSHSHYEHQNPDSRYIHSSSYPPFVPGANEGELFGEVHTQYVQSVSSDKWTCI